MLSAVQEGNKSLLSEDPQMSEITLTDKTQLITDMLATVHLDPTGAKILHPPHPQCKSQLSLKTVRVISSFSVA